MAGVRQWRMAGAAAALLLACACATLAPPEAELTRAHIAVENVVAAGDGEWAPQALRAAQEALARAQSLSEDEDYTAARRVAETAASYAELARARAAAARATVAAEEAERDLRRLREQIQRMRAGS